MSSTQRYRRTPSFSSSTTSSLAKKRVPATATEIPAKGSSSATSGKKRVPLGNITNQSNGARTSSLVPSANKIAKIKKAQPTSVSNTGSVGNALPSSLNVKPSSLVLPKITGFTALPRANDVHVSNILPAHCSINLSPCESNDASVSMDETMSTCDSFKSPEVEYLDKSDDTVIDSIERKTFSNLHISDDAETDPGSICDRDVLAEMDIDDKVVNLDNNYNDPQLCATFACDIYKHLRASEAKKRPSTNFMEKVQTDINASMRGILVDWLIEVSEEYRLVPDTLFLTVNYIDRYLSGNVMNRQRLQLLGVACMMIAAKYEEICAPQVEEFCYITDNTYFKEEVLDMESAVLNYLKFEMTAPTAKCFLRRFVRAAQGINEVPSMQLECMANYITELSLLEYNMLRYAPSLLAASAIFLAKFILLPSKRPWNSTLQHYTQYKPSDLIECVKDLHQLCCNSQSSSLPAVREKYSQHKYKCVSKNHCPVLIPSEFFHN